MLDKLLLFINQNILGQKEITIIIIFSLLIVSIFLQTLSSKKNINFLPNLFFAISICLSIYALLLVMLMANHFSCYLFVSIIIVYFWLTDDIKKDILAFLEAYGGRNGTIQNISEQEELLKNILKEVKNLNLTSCQTEQEENKKIINLNSHSIKTDAEWSKYLREGILKSNSKDLYVNKSKNIIYEKNKKITYKDKVIYPDGVKRKGNTDYILEIKHINNITDSTFYTKLYEIFKNYIIFYKENLSKKKLDILLKLIVQYKTTEDKNIVDKNIKIFQDTINEIFKNKYTVQCEIEEE